MPLSSMTGFGKGKAARGAVAVEVELSSVNRRQLEFRASMPRTLSVLESRLAELVRKRLSRGTVAANVRVMDSAAARAGRVKVDATVAANVLRDVRRVGRRLGLRDDLGMSAMLVRPEFLVLQDPTENAERVWPILRRAFLGALQELDRMRRTEGRELEKDLLARLSELDRLLTRIRRLAPGVPVRHAALLRSRLAQNNVAGLESGDAVARELALFADRCDVSEEIVRLASHMKQFRASLRASGESGRTMDFLCQEMFREANTIGSKASDAEIGSLIVGFKTALEKMREQVQNVE